MSPRVGTYSLCCLPVELPSFAYSFSASFASIYSRQMSYSPLKILHGKLELSTTINNNIISKSRGPYLPLYLGQEDEVVWWVCVREKWKPLASGGQSSPKLTPTLSASPHVPEEGILTGTSFARNQVPDCPDFTSAKNKLPFWDKYFNGTVKLSVVTVQKARRRKRKQID